MQPYKCYGQQQAKTGTARLLPTLLQYPLEVEAISLTQGLLDTLLVHAREVFRAAILANAAAVVLATAGSSFAATYAWVDHGTNVKKNHFQVAPTVNHVSPGEKVKIIGQWNNWYKIQIPGPDGWVKKSALDFSPWGNGNWGNGGGQFWSRPTPGAQHQHTHCRRA